MEAIPFQDREGGGKQILIPVIKGKNNGTDFLPLGRVGSDRSGCNGTSGWVLVVLLVLRRRQVREKKGNRRPVRAGIH